MTPSRFRALALGLVLLAVASVSVDCGRTFVISDMRGAPVRDAYVAYHHEGTTFAVVEAVTYRASRPALVRSDAGGRVVIPRAVLAHWPLIQSHPEVNIDLIYAPSLHNGLARVSRHGVVSRPREFDVSADRALVRLEDVSSDPVLWHGTLVNLEGVLSDLLGQPTSGAETPKLADELLDHFKREYGAILDQHGDAPRPRPRIADGLLETERAATLAMIDKDLAERPLWKDELKRLMPYAIESPERRPGRR